MASCAEGGVSRSMSAESESRPLMSLLTELDAFFTYHHACGDLDAGVDGPVVWIACDCGVEDGAAGGRGRRTCLQRLTRPIVPAWTAAASC